MTKNRNKDDCQRFLQHITADTNRKQTKVSSSGNANLLFVAPETMNLIAVLKLILKV